MRYWNPNIVDSKCELVFTKTNAFEPSVGDKNGTGEPTESVK